VKLSAPARRALERKGITSVKKLSVYSEKEIMELHGMGKASLPALKNVLSAAGLNFKTAS
jgi:DNA-directed RNA polymerase alpha subunit